MGLQRLGDRDARQWGVLLRGRSATALPEAVALRGLNKNYNHDLKWILKSAAVRASSSAGPLHEFYESLLAKGMKPAMARLTLARKIAAIILIVWKKGARFDAEHLKPQAA